MRVVTTTSWSGPSLAIQAPAFSGEEKYDRGESAIELAVRVELGLEHLDAVADARRLLVLLVLDDALEVLAQALELGGGRVGGLRGGGRGGRGRRGGGRRGRVRVADV